MVATGVAVWVATRTFGHEASRRHRPLPFKSAYRVGRFKWQWAVASSMLKSPFYNAY